MGMSEAYWIRGDAKCELFVAYTSAYTHFEDSCIDILVDIYLSAL